MIRYWNIHDWMRAKDTDSDARHIFRHDDYLRFRCLHGNDPIWCRECEELDKGPVTPSGWTTILDELGF